MMVLPASDALLCSDDLKFLPKMLTDEESLQKEKQISVDPISMKEPEPENVCLSLPPSIVKPTIGNGMSKLVVPLLPSKYKFLSTSLPNSASSSPRFSSGLLKSKGKNQCQAGSSPSIGALAQQHSVALTRLAQLRESHLQRSKSCGEGRASALADDFDMWLTTINPQSQSSASGEGGKAEAGRTYGYNRCEEGKEKLKSYDEEFKCGALCLFLPAFGKGKPVRAVRKEEPEIEIGHVISRTVSLEKFECGSWTSSAIINDHEEDGHSSNLFFDLPLELIQSSVNDANLPVNSAFVFDKDRKGVLKNSASRGTGQKSQESSRHVRFSTSSPKSYPTSPSSCITPRLHKAREDFNAFLEAQSA